MCGIEIVYAATLPYGTKILYGATRCARMVLPVHVDPCLGSELTASPSYPNFLSKSASVYGGCADNSLALSLQWLREMLRVLSAANKT
eukprot:596925-Rhodomonas_salina.1